MLWGAAISHTSPFASAIVRFGLPFLILAAAAAQWASRGPAAALVWGWSVLSFSLLAVWAYRFVPGAVQLNAPANAKLVPRARQRLTELFCLVWVAGIAGLAPAWYLDGATGLMLIWCVGLSLGSALAAAGHAAGTPIMLTVLFATAFSQKLPPALGAMLSQPASMVLLMLLSIGLAAIAARLVFPAAGERHWRMLARRARWVDAAGKPGIQDDKSPRLKSRRWYAATLRRDSARRDKRRLVLHALGPTQHIDELVMGLGGLSAVVFVLGTFIGWRTGDEVMAGIGWLFACTLLAVPFAASLRLTGLLATYSGEQSLVRLAPAMPSVAPAFNRHLAQAVLVHGLKGWALATGAALAVGALGGAERDKLADLACVCCLMLPMAAAPLRDYAARKSASPMMPIVLLLASIYASVALGFAASLTLDAPVLPVAAVVSIGLAAFAIMRGLRVMERAPCAFPAGRIA
ncbi:MAG: hypothetical protein EOP92_05150 [Lysobacteraceae bacterium]|nr:MAG: hypothetical protein EOP92_05150 [Xanthomonadaceae bacterium]